jgi:hypothetical protein
MINDQVLNGLEISLPLKRRYRLQEEGTNVTDIFFILVEEKIGWRK